MNTPQRSKGIAVPIPLPFQTPGEEIANSILHGIGSLLAVAGLVLLVLRGIGYLGGSGGGALPVTAFIIFTVTMIIMFLASTLYHAIQHEGAKRVFRILDHSAIYLLIAGTYTPLCLVGLRGVWGWTIFGIEWALALTGITLYAVNCTILKKIELGVYIAMGWAVVISWIPLYHSIPLISLILIGAGGVSYTLGTLWYSKPQKRGTHVTWHVFVLIGAVLHWWAIWFLS
ncbi:hemolysin III [Spirochaetia bacterium]|nr:hemolysin III [Spirochaetia bacterium]